MAQKQSVWSDKKSLLFQLEKLWDKGILLQELLNGSGIFPLRLKFGCPESRSLGGDFAKVKDWIAEIQNLSGFRIVYKTVHHRVIGENSIPSEVWVDTVDTAVSLLNKQKQVLVFTSLVDLTQKRAPHLLAWMSQNPIKTLSFAEVWPNLLDFVLWRQRHPNPDIYLRQVNLPGIDTKFIEQYRSIVASLLDQSLSAKQINNDMTGMKYFEQRYGFRSKPDRIRFRLLDSALTLLPGADNDINVTSNDFQALYQHPEFARKIKRVFVTENEINFLAFPLQKNSLVVFGAGYGFEGLAKVNWLSQLEIFYWGDIDTHGFAILDQLRSKFPQVKSFLMDEPTLLAHREFWGQEDKPESRELSRLSADEQSMYQALLANRYKKYLRLEQEQINYEYLITSLSALAGSF
jgi:hypothetical protein